MPKSNSNIHLRTPKNILKNRSDSFNSNNTISTITLRNGTEKRIRNKQTYRELYLERMSYIPIELPKSKERNTSKKTSFVVSEDDYQILYSNKYPTIEASSFNTKLLKKELMNNDKYCVEIGKNVGSVLRTQMLKRAKELNITVTNQKSKKIERLADKLKKKTN